MPVNEAQEERPVVKRRCYDCGCAMEGKRGNYKYIDAGLSSVNLVNILVFHCTNRKCGAVVPEIPAISQLHRAIAYSLLEKETLLTGEEIKFLRKMSGLTGTDLASLLGTHATNLSKWESGARKVSKKADVALRLLSFAAIMQELMNRDHLVPTMAEAARRLSMVDLKKILQGVQDILDGPKRVTIDPSTMEQFGEVPNIPPLSAISEMVQ